MKYLKLQKLLAFICLISTFLTIGFNSRDNSYKSTKDKASEVASKGLKDYYNSFFPIGVAVSPKALKLESQANLIKEHFSSMTAENVMKMGPIHPKENEYNWEPADVIVAFAEEHNLVLRGHTLCWHHQTPDWLFIGNDGKQVSKEILLNRLEEHIKNVMGRYKGKIYAWDVVNEAISDKPNEFYRNSKWFQICGEDYIIKAFQYARKMDSEVKLFYNDYNVINPVKREKIFQMVKDLKEKGVPIDGIGIQGHWSVYEPSESQVRATLERFAPLDVELQITELDISIYRKEHLRRERRKNDMDIFTPELEQLQMEKYKMIFDVFREYKNVLTGVTFWNISDRRSWLDNFPVRGRKDYPLLFDHQEKPKKAYWEVIDF